MQIEPAHNPDATLVAADLRRRIEASRATPQWGAYVGPANEQVRDKFVLDPRDPAKYSVPLEPPGFTALYRNDSWTLYTRGCP